MNKKHFITRLFVIFSTITISACTQYGRVVNSQVKTNTKEALETPYVLLISLDGFRWDYVERFNPPHLKNFIKNGVQAESLIPCFPSKTFPNHYSIATGMYPDKHNIVGNSFYDHNKNAQYSLQNRVTVEDGSFYAGTPIWVQAAKSGMVTASYFFVGSEAEIQGFRPSTYYNFDGKTTHQTRVNQILDWLALPKKTRPHLLTLYFADMDKTGHIFGPNNDEKIQHTLLELDKTLGALFNGIKQSRLPVNIVIVSDHGMMNIPVNDFIRFETIEDNSSYMAIDNGSLINIHPKDISQTNAIFNTLKKKAKNQHYQVYKTQNTPGFEYVPKNKNWGAIQIIAEKGYYFLKSEKIKEKKESGNNIFGVHGFDTKNKEMHGIFYANGPAFKKGLTIPSFKNIHVYPLLSKILGLDVPSDVDGKIEVLENVLTQISK